MQLNELIGVLDHIDKFFTKHNLPNQYRKLISTLNQARKKPTPDTATRIIQQRERIRSAHNATKPEKWSRSSQKLYEKLGTPEIMGNVAMNRIDNIFQMHEADPNSIAQAMEELAGQTTALIERVRSLLDSLKSLAEEAPDTLPDTTTLQILYPESTSALTMQNLENALQQWDHAVAAFSRLTRQLNEDSIVLNIEQNPLLIEVAVFDGVTSAVGRATCEVLGVYEKYLDIKRVGLEVDNLELRNRGIAEQLDKEAELLLRNTATNVTKALMEEFGWKKEANRNDVHNLVSTAVATIFEFVKDEGSIEVHEAGKSTSTVQEQLTAAFSQVHALETQISKLTFQDTQEDFHLTDLEIENDEPVD